MQNAINLEAYDKDNHSRSFLVDYSVLLAIVLVSLAVFFTVAFTKELQLITLMITALAYLLWGLVHHYRKDMLTWKIVSEYTAFSSFLICILGVTITVFG